MFSSHTKILAGLSLASGLGWVAAEISRSTLPTNDEVGVVEKAPISGLDRVAGALAGATISAAIFTIYRANQDSSRREDS